MAPQRRIGYLISQYPAVNHTFILREIRQLRTAGWDIHAFSIAGCDRPVAKLTPEEAEEHTRTTYIKAAGASRILGAGIKALLRNPLRFVSALLFALGLGHSSPRRLLANLFYFAEAVVAGEWMRERGIAHYHVHFSSTVALILSRLHPISFSVTIHGPDEFNDAAGFELARKVEAARFIVAISHYAQSQIMRASEYTHWHKIEVCRLGIDPAVFAPRTPSDAGGQVRLLCVGRLAPVKGQHILLGAVRRIIDAGHTEVMLHLAGDGPDRAGLEQHAAALSLREYVRFEGWLNQDRIRALYAQTDIFVLASFAEGVPVVLMEAMAMEIPCVSTIVNGIPELIDNGVDGLLVPPSDEEAFARAVVTLLTDPERRRVIGSAARRKVSLVYCLPTNVSKLSALFDARLGRDTHAMSAEA